MLLFKPNDRVWVLTEGTWWPAKILSDELAAPLGKKPPGQDYAVEFYGLESVDENGVVTDGHTFGFASRDHVEAYETSSEKAVSSNVELLAAIKQASMDGTANPLLDVFSVRQKRSLAEPAAGGAKSAAKQPRTDAAARGAATANQKSLHINNSSSDGDSYPKHVVGFQYEDVSTLIDIARRLRDANAASDLTNARKQLMRLDKVKILREQLETTRIGVAIGDVLGNPRLEKLWPLAKALVNWFVLALPKETLSAIQNFHEVRSAEKTDISVARETVAAAATDTLGSSSTLPRPVQKLAAMLSLEQATIQKLGPSFDVDAFATALFQAIGDTEKRRDLIAQVSKPGHGKLRQDLLTGALTPEAFKQLPPSAFKTQDEMDAEERRISETIANQDKEEAQDSVGTEMFECTNCHKRNARYHEQQTRGADEPTTKFVTCLECKHRWTTE